MATKKLKVEDIAHIIEPLRSFATPVDELVLDSANARKHGERNLETIRNSLKRFGFRMPVVVQKQGMIVRAGNARVTVARSLGWKYVPAVVVDEKDVEATAYAIADNRTSELAEWDSETLASLLESLPKDARVDAGFDEGELDELLKSLGQEEPALNGQNIGDVEYRIIVKCDGENQQAELIETLEGQGYECQPLMS